MNGLELSEALREGTRVYGTAILSPSPLWPKTVQSIGLDFVFIDTEHTPLDRGTVSWMTQSFRAHGLAPLVRISSPDPYLACMALDGGATGIIAPYIETREEVEALVRAVKYRPVKGRRMSSTGGIQSLEPTLSEYLREVNRDCILIVNIESAPAIEALGEILDVEGLDGILIGPHDLTCSLGIPEQYGHPLFKSSVAKIIALTRSRGIAVGVHTWDAAGIDQEISWAKMGANITMHSSDLMLFKGALKKNIDVIKAGLI